MFSWLNDLLTKSYDYALEWIYNLLFDGMASFFAGMGGMGAEIFSLPWIQAMMRLFRLFGGLLFVVGFFVAISEFGIEQGNGRTSVKGVAMNIMKGAFAAGLFGVLPVALYKFCINLQLTFLTELGAEGAGSFTDFGSLGSVALNVLKDTSGILGVFYLVAMGYCVIKVFFSNIQRGGILLIQIAVGSLYMLSIPRGYTDGFNQWCKQVIALCLTAFIQTTLLYLGLVTWEENILLGLGIMLAANTVPRIAQQFGLDSSVKVNVMSAAYTANSAINLTRMIRAR